MAFREYAVYYLDIREAIERFTDEELGQAFRAMIMYASDDVWREPEWTGNAEFFWPTLKRFADRSDEKGGKISGTNKKSGCYKAYKDLAKMRGIEPMSFEAWGVLYDNGELDSHWFPIDPTLALGANASAESER